MLRIFAMMAIVALAGNVDTNTPRSESSGKTQTDVDSLKDQRVKLLQDRVGAIKKWVDLGRAGASDLIRPEMDVINAQLEYATSNAVRVQLLDELLSKYDNLIELAEFAQENPKLPSSANTNAQMLAESELFQLKSERIRILIQRESLK